MEDRLWHNSNFDGKESTALYFVLDGHGGSQVAQYCQENLPKTLKELYNDYQNDIQILIQKTLEKVNEELEKTDFANSQGSCVCIALLRIEEDAKKMCYVSNLGDTRAVLTKSDGTAQRISVDHKVTKLNILV